MSRKFRTQRTRWLLVIVGGFVAFHGAAFAIIALHLGLSEAGEVMQAVFAIYAVILFVAGILWMGADWARRGE
jgi:uncharacterized membrane protein